MSHASALWRSGSRLKINVDRVGDVDQFSYLRDSLRNEPCFVSNTADGELRCVPDSSHTVFYTDAGCTMPVVRLAAPSNCGGALSAAAVASITDPVGAYCPEHTETRRIFELGAAVAAPLAVFSRDPSGACNSAPLGAGDFVALGAEIPPATFVKMSPKDEARGAGLVVRSLVGDDGSLLVAGARAVKLDVACSPAKTSTGDRCIPIGAPISTQYFADVDCTVETFALSDPTCKAEAFGSRVTPDPADACGEEISTAYAVGSPVPTAHSLNGTGQCVDAGSGVPRPLAMVGAQLPDDELPALERVMVGTGPVRVAEWRSGGAAVARDYQLKTVDGALCLSQQLVDGKARCAPPTLLYLAAVPRQGDFFADAACTQRLAPFSSSRPECATPPNTVAMGTDSCGGTRELQRGSLFTDPLFTLDPQMACIAAVRPVDQTFYVVGDELPPTTFPEVVSVEL